MSKTQQIRANALIDGDVIVSSKTYGTMIRGAVKVKLVKPNGSIVLEKPKAILLHPHEAVNIRKRGNGNDA